ncbi:MAG: 23S rRNA (uracil(1939)-C(5))-methyltransferase RlmD [Candidatus Gastranaerophilales bacterium]|nr:23S rRNA (uracil(1939)-C(5))-methyltransferase RlmD [Candidatus Gastranaerophilales bacterium]
MDNKEVTVNIEKLIYGGQALARLDDYPVFIDGGCPEDTVIVDVIKRNKTYGIGKIKEIVKPSDKRVKPFCPLHKVCGGCGVQHIDYAEQLKQKQLIVEETLEKIYGKKLNVMPVKAPENNKNYRYKVQYPVSQTKVSERILAGYYKKGTHEIVNIKYCPVQPQILDEITEFIRTKAAELKISGYNEKKHSGMLRHIIYRMSKFNGEILIILVLNSDMADKKVKKLAEELGKINKVSGVAANFNTAKTNVIQGKKYQTLFGKDFITEKIGEIIYKISAGSFFQVNPDSAEIIFNTAKEMIMKNTKNPVILDAYSGVSSFGLQMKDIAKEVICVEESKSSTDDAAENVKINHVDNVTVINDDAAKVFEQFVREEKKFDVILLDPPRKGCSEQALDYAAKLSKEIIVYVSCNPSSLARDLKYLGKKGFTAENVQPVDMFCHTPHIENVVLIRKQNDLH